jgi:hypothetical protein
MEVFMKNYSLILLILATSAMLAMEKEPNSILGKRGAQELEVDLDENRIDLMRNKQGSELVIL